MISKSRSDGILFVSANDFENPGILIVWFLEGVLSAKLAFVKGLELLHFGIKEFIDGFFGGR
jgi:hypothetical protein